MTSEQVLPAALTLARRMKLPIILLGVNEPDHEIDSSYINNKAFDLVSEGVETRPSVRSVEKKGFVADYIARFAHENESTLIAMATHGRSGITRSLAGSTAWKMLSVCTVPLLLFKAQSHPVVNTLKDASNVLLPLDGSTNAEAAMPFAENIASQMGADLLLYQAADPDYSLTGVSKPRTAASPLEKDLKAKTKAEAYLKNAAARIKKVKVTYEAVLGTAAECICRRAAKPDIAFVFMSTHGYSGMTCFIKGCVAEQVLGKCTTPVILISPQ
jgi:nucleotide-binding universal stress UspA family protein